MGRRHVAFLSIALALLAAACSAGDTGAADLPAGGAEPGTGSATTEEQTSTAAARLSGAWEIRDPDDDGQLELLVLTCTGTTCTSEAVTADAGAETGQDFEIRGYRAVSIIPPDAECAESVPAVYSLDGDELRGQRPNTTVHSAGCVRHQGTPVVGTRYAGSIDDWLADRAAAGD